jgi:selenide,water dikinase
VKQNNTAKAGNKIYLTKPLGIGILTTAQKKNKLLQEDLTIAAETMCQLNSLGTKLSDLTAVTAMTDVTGFGLGGHLREVCEGSKTSAIINFDKLPLLPHVLDYLEQGCSPGGCDRNFASYGDKISKMSDIKRQIICDPQTSGGLLVMVDKDTEQAFLEITKNAGMDLDCIGHLVDNTEIMIEII